MTERATGRQVDVFFSLQSDYCYLLLDRLMWLDARPEAEVAIRPVLPGLIRNADAFRDRSPAEMQYFDVDTARTADFLGMPYRYPDPSPVAFIDGSVWIAAPEQPRIDRLYRAFVAAARAGAGLAFVDQVMRLIWDGRTRNWQDDNHLANAVARAGLDLSTLLALPDTDYEATLAENHAAMAEAGHWGVPLTVVQGEPFYGQDRFDQVLWRLGITDRS